MASQDVNWHDLCRLASLLRESGDKVLSGNSKLRLTPALLMKLNAAFSDVSIVGCNNDFQVTSAHASQPPYISQLHFLHDFVQKTIGLTIAGSTLIHMDQHTGRSIDLSRFRSLRHLELRSCISTHEDDLCHVLKGLSTLRSQIETLVLMQIVVDQDLIWNILANDATTIISGDMWPRLTQFVISYCGLHSLGSGLSYASNLQWLDASHNMLTDSEEVGRCLGALPKLRYLNLSFNRLTCVPVPTSGSSRTISTQLQILILSHNYIDSLCGIEHLTGIVELNLAANQLRNHLTLHPLYSLFQMQHVKLDGNPLSFHKHHRLFTAYNLSPRAVFSKHRYRRDATRPSPFLLDGIKLSENEMDAVRFGTSRFSSKINTSEASALSFEPGGAQSNSQEKGKARRNRKVRNAVIADLDGDETNLECAVNNSSDSLESSDEHLWTRQELESVRKKFGQDNWLRAKARPAVQEVFGLPPSAPVLDVNSVGNPSSIPQPLSSSTPLISPSASATTPFTSQLDVEAMENLVLEIQPLSVGSSSACESLKRVDRINVSSITSSQSAVYTTANDSDSTSSQSAVYTTANDSDSGLQVTAEAINVSDSTLSIKVDASEETVVDEEDNHSEEDIDEDSGAGDHSKFVVQEVVSGSRVLGDLFLVLSPRFIREVNSSTGQSRQRWVLDTLQTCVMISASPCFVQLSFNTVVQSKKERVYQMDLTEAQQQLLPMLQKILEARSLSAMNFAAFRCMNCSGEFSADLKSKKGSRKCPTCGSVLVFELDEAPLPSLGSEIPARPLVPEVRHTALEETSDLSSSIIHSPSCSSIGSAASLESPNNAIQYNTPTVSNLHRCESDIDIISNPSQSSIEVLDEISRSGGTPGRKRSSEERQVVAIPSLHPVPECSSTLAPLAAGLTESSSSGSLTDSVCTAYENNPGTVGSSHRILHGLASTTLKEETSRENSPQFVENLDSSILAPQSRSLSIVLDGLLQTMSSKISAEEGSQRRIVRKLSPATENRIQYNYTDFSSIDHRLKLHLCLSVLDADEREVIQLLLRAEIILNSSGARYPGILIITSQRVCVIKITGPEEGDSVERWFSRIIALPRRNIQRFTALPWNTGFLLFIQGSSNLELMFILRDQQYLENFFSFLSKVPQESNWSIEEVAQENHSLKANLQLIHLAQESFSTDVAPSLKVALLLCANCIENDNGKQVCEGGLFILASNGLILCDDDLSWLLPSEKSNNSCTLNCLAKQLISNLIEAKTQGLVLSLHFLDEAIEGEEVWHLTLQSESVFEQIVNAIRSPWEELFSIPFQVTHL